MPSRQPDDLLADLARHPGWAVLAERVTEQQQRDAEDLGRALLRGADPLDPAKLARVRGFWAGQRWILRAARNELALLQKNNHTAE